MRIKTGYFKGGAILATVTLGLAIAGMGWDSRQKSEPVDEYIVQAATMSQALAAVEQVSGEVSAQLGVINAVGARLSNSQIAQLQLENPKLRVSPNRSVRTNGKTDNDDRKGKKGKKDKKDKKDKDDKDDEDDKDDRKGKKDKKDKQDKSSKLPGADFPGWVGADKLHAAGIDGAGVKIAMLDTGLWKKSAREYEVTEGFVSAGVARKKAKDKGKLKLKDENGHGTHLAAVAAGRTQTATGEYSGIAPGADVVVVRAFDEKGQSSYIDVIEGLDWVVKNGKELNIRVLNLSFSAPPQSRYWDDPLNQAVMAAWEAGIVVVVSAGNTGPTPMSIGVPGNVPYVITVGAASDNHSPDDGSDDFLTYFSAAGPTHDGFVKPDLVAPGAHILARMNPNGYLAKMFGEYLHETADLFNMSGTSQAAAVISGVSALMLQADPSLSPDDLKCRLMASSRPALNADGSMLYSVFQQGAGLVDAEAAVYSTASACANVGMDIDADLAGIKHYAGPAALDEDGSFYVLDLSGESADGRVADSGYNWDGDYVYSQGYTWGGNGGGGLADPGAILAQIQGYTWGGNGGGGLADPGNILALVQGYTWGGNGGGGLADPRSILALTQGYTWGGNGGGGLADPDGVLALLQGYTWGGNGGGGVADPRDVFALIQAYTWGEGSGGGLTINAWVDPEPPREREHAEIAAEAGGI